MSAEKQRFTIRASASRLEKGLLAVPQKFKDWFPGGKGQIQVIFDDEEKARALTFHPYDPIVKENRIFGLGHWFSKRSVREGDAISITVEDLGKRLYRIALDRFVRERQEQEARHNLREAGTDSEAEQELSTLSRLTRKRPRELAQEELLRIAQESVRRPRPRAFPDATERYEGVPSGIRVLLRELHDGKCQLCSFTFEKRNGEPYFEIHHLDPLVGHHPSNLLVVCPNCHAQFEHATVTNFTWADGWLVRVIINGKRVAVRQPLAHDSMSRTPLALGIVVVATRVGRLLVR
ncbi:MAG TPA: HNH endonuclease signature motif containing protein [Terriglobia bacterium]|nr:HNH endonuclease signature motif containing protein [Terriglobia bacterium]